MPLPKPPTKKASLLVAADFDVAAAPRSDQSRRRAESDALVAEPELFETPARTAPVASMALLVTLVCALCPSLTVASVALTPISAPEEPEA